MNKMILAASALILLTVGNNLAADEGMSAPQTIQQAGPVVNAGDSNGTIAPTVQPSNPPAKTAESNMANEATKWVDQTKKLGETAWDASKKAAGKATTATKKTAGDVYDATKEKSSTVWQATKKAAGNIYDTTKEEAAKAYESVKSK